MDASETSTPSASRMLRVAATLAILCFALLQFAENKADVDLWGNAGFVHALPGSDGFLNTNTFSYTEPDRPWVNHEWGAEYIYNKALSALGTGGMLLTKILLGFGVLLLIRLGLRRDAVSGHTQFILLLVLLSTMGYGFSTRPHHFTFAAYALLLFALLHLNLRRPLFWAACALLGCVWANTHGAYFVGMLLLWVWAISCAFRRATRADALTAAVGGGVFFLATFLNPYGPSLWDFVFESAGHIRPQLSEWAPFDPLLHGADHADFIALSALTLVAVFVARRQLAAQRIVILLITFCAALGMRRNIPFFAINVGLLAGPYIDRLLGAPLRDLAARLQTRVTVVLLAMFAALSVYYAAAVKAEDPLRIEIPQDQFPTEMIHFMRDNELRGNALIFWDWAEYAIWHLSPQRVRVFMDGRFRSAYGPEVIDDYFRFLYAGEDWDRALTAYPTDIVVLHQGNPAYPLMQQRAGWDEVYLTTYAALFLKQGPHDYLLGRPLAMPRVVEPVIFP